MSEHLGYCFPPGWISFEIGTESQCAIRWNSFAYWKYQITDEDLNLINQGIRPVPDPSTNTPTPEPTQEPTPDYPREFWDWFASHRDELIGVTVAESYEYWLTIQNRPLPTPTPEPTPTTLVYPPEFWDWYSIHYEELFVFSIDEAYQQWLAVKESHRLLQTPKDAKGLAMLGALGAIGLGLALLGGKK